jgi:hypothetical protein
VEVMRQQGDEELLSEEDQQAKKLAVLDALSSTLAAKRREAVGFKSTCGIETEFLGDEEFYQGYDNANRHEFVNTLSKPTQGGATSPENRVRPSGSGSTVFPNITQPYVDAASARVGDMLLPTDDRNFAIEPTPIPEMFDGLDKQIQQSQQRAMAAPLPQGQMQDSAMLGVPGGPMPVQPQGEPQLRMPDGQVMGMSQAKQFIDQMKAEAQRKADKAQTQIDDWLTEAQYHAQLRAVIDDAAKLGSGVIKGPVPVKRTSRQWRQNPQTGVHELVIVEEIKPGSMRVDPWDLFPDPACGESIHNGAYIFERGRLTGKRLHELMGTPGYLDSQIMLCLKEGPNRKQEADARHQVNDSYVSKEQYEIWYYHGEITVDELRCAGVDIGEDDSCTGYPAMITMVNDRVIKASLNPLDDGDFPYDVIPWKRRTGIPWGMGVARQMRTPQRIIVAATRNLMDNAGLAAGPQLVLRQGMRPENGVYEVKPLKFWVEESDTGTPGTGVPMSAVVIPMLEESLMRIIQFGQKMAEDVTGLPMLMQGQQGAAPETVGGMQILNNNANSVLRRIARLFDSCITEPHIRRYYSWLMEYGEDDDAKGDYQIVARGSSALVERDIQSQELVNIVQLCLNPAFGKNPAKAMDEYLKSRRFDPAAFDYTDQEKEAMKNQPPPEDPRVTAAKIMAQSRGQDLDKKLSADQQAAQIDAQERERDRQMEILMAQMDAEMETRSQDGQQNMSLGEIKAMLAATVMKLNTQRELSAKDQVHERTMQALTPPTEPVGRAKTGEAFQA